MKEIFITFKEGLIVIVFLCLIIFPSFVKGVLGNLGISQINIAGMTAQIDKQEKTTKVTANDADSLHRQLTSLNDTLNTIRQKIKDSAGKRIVAELSAKTSSMLQASNALNDNIINQISEQQNFAKQNLNADPLQQGWIFAGKKDEAQANWVANYHNTIKELKPAYSSGDKLTIIDNVYVRDGFHSSSNIVTVAKEGQQVEYIEMQSLHALGGGYFIWFKIKV